MTEVSVEDVSDGRFILRRGLMGLRARPAPLTVWETFRPSSVIPAQDFVETFVQVHMASFCSATNVKEAVFVAFQCVVLLWQRSLEQFFMYLQVPHTVIASWQ